MEGGQSYWVKHVKLPARRAGLPGKELFNYIEPLEPAYKAKLAGALPVKYGREWVSSFLRTLDNSP